ERLRQAAEDGLLSPHLPVGGLTGAHLDATEPGSDRPVRSDQSQADLSAALDVGAAAQLAGPFPEGDDANAIPVLLVEERHRAAADRLLQRHLVDPVDLGMDRFARGWGATPDPDPVADGLALRLDVDDLSLSPTPGHPAAVRSLPAALRVERRLGQKEVDQLGLAGHLEELADRRIRLQLLVSGEARRGPGDGTAEGSSHTATAFSLRLHELIDPQGVDADPAVPRQLQ